MSQAPLTYSTPDIGVATMLCTCGAEFPRNEKGEVIPFFNVYTAKILRQKNYPAGMRIEEAALDAWSKGIRGFVNYCFLQTPLWQRLLEAWKKQSELIAKGAEAESTNSGIQVDPEMAARILCQAATNRKWLAEGWRKVSPAILCNEKSESRTEPGQDEHGNPITRTIVVGSFRMETIEPGPALRRQMGMRSL